MKNVVSVVGATGAGKSSVINAMLDEERLVSTNCMRACTAVVTEISYNYEDVCYQAEIEFISRQDWAKELKILFQDLIDGSGQVSRECANEASDAGIAYAKIRAIYPKLTKDDMALASVESLMAQSTVNCGDTRRKVEHNDCMLFYKKLQQNVDSREKSAAKEKNDKEKKAREMEFWPLIRVVIVDLPGVHDSNQARAVVAQNYMKQCTGLWIMAPITRAADDKSAKTLLGDSFKRQLKMDGGYSAVSFICSKTDDISLTEAQDSLSLEEEMVPLYEQINEISKSKESLQAKFNDLRYTRSDIAAAMESADEEIEVWEKLQEDESDGRTVYKPSQIPRSGSPRPKRLRCGRNHKYTEVDSDDDDFIDDRSNASDAGSDYDETSPKPLASHSPRRRFLPKSPSSGLRRRKTPTYGDR
jgi:GTPase SAR1 family protein